MKNNIPGWVLMLGGGENDYDVDIYQTTHRPYIRDGKPYGKEIEIAHNLTLDVYVHITPGTGSRYQIISKEKAKELWADGKILTYSTRKDENFRIFYEPSTGEITKVPKMKLKQIRKLNEESGSRIST